MVNRLETRHEHFRFWYLIDICRQSIHIRYSVAILAGPLRLLRISYCSREDQGARFAAQNRAIFVWTFDLAWIAIVLVFFGWLTSALLIGWKQWFEFTRSGIGKVLLDVYTCLGAIHDRHVHVQNDRSVVSAMVLSYLLQRLQTILHSVHLLKVRRQLLLKRVQQENLVIREKHSWPSDCLNKTCSSFCFLHDRVQRLLPLFDQILDARMVSRWSFSNAVGRVLVYLIFKRVSLSIFCVFILGWSLSRALKILEEASITLGLVCHCLTAFTWWLIIFLDFAEKIQP